MWKAFNNLFGWGEPISPQLEQQDLESEEESMTYSDLELGDIVFLESGGPPMTVTNICNNTITTAWFDEEYTLHTAVIVAEALTFDDPS